MRAPRGVEDELCVVAIVEGGSAINRVASCAQGVDDLTRESYTRLLWAFEGITSYYDDLALARSGVLPVGDYLELVGRTIRPRRGALSATCRSIAYMSVFSRGSWTASESTMLKM